MPGAERRCLLDVAHTTPQGTPDLVIPSSGAANVRAPGGQRRHASLPSAGRAGNIDFLSVFRSLKSIGYASYVNVDYGGVPADQILAEVTQAEPTSSSA